MPANGPRATRSAASRVFAIFSPARVVVHEYIHLLLNHGTAPLPLWFEEGTAEFYSNLEFTRGRLLAGMPIAEHAATLDSGEWLTAAELAAVTRTSRVYD